MNSSVPWFSKSQALKCELAGEVLRSSGRLRLQVTGWSMLPTIRPGDVLLIERAHAEEVSEGDIVLLSRDRRLIVHRIVRQEGGAMLTQGDGNPTADSPVDATDVLGKVSFILRNGRCIEPQKSLRVSERAVAALVRRSAVAARFLVGIHDMCQTSQVQVSQPQIPNDRVVPCQP
jgi:signal peptidase I